MSGKAIIAIGVLNFMGRCNCCGLPFYYTMIAGDPDAIPLTCVHCGIPAVHQMDDDEVVTPDDFATIANKIAEIKAASEDTPPEQSEG